MIALNITFADYLKATVDGHKRTPMEVAVDYLKSKGIEGTPILNESGELMGWFGVEAFQWAIHGYFMRPTASAAEVQK